MKNEPIRTHARNQSSSGLTNDFSDQEETMTRSAMPPKFALTASAAGDGDPAKSDEKPRLNLTGVPPELVKLLEDFEGIRWNVYEDHLGNLTGGMGHLIKPDEKAAFPGGTAITEAQVQAWAQEDVSAAWQTAQAQSAELGVADHDFYLALASMCFQNGLSWNGKHIKTWELMKEHKWEEAALECADSKWARETPKRVPGFQAALRSQIAGGGASPAGTAHVETHIAEPFRKRADEAKAGKGNQSKTERKSTAATAMPEGKEGMKLVQTKLQALGLYSGKIDGIATSSKGESNTTKGIKQFQQAQGLPVTGEVDAATWAALGEGRKPSVWKRFMAGIEEPQKAKKGSSKDDGGLAAPFRKLADEGKGKDCDEVSTTRKVATEAGWSVPPILGEEQYYSQIHPNAGSDHPIPRSVAFSGDLVKYDHGGSQDIYDDSKCKEGWRVLSTVDREKKVYGLACKNTCDFIVGNAGYSPTSSAGSIYSLIEKKEGGTTSLAVADTYHDAKNRLDTYLEQGIPVVVGMDYKSNGANSSATDHFVIVVGRGEDEKGVFYAYMDVGRTLAADGLNFQKNRIYVGVGKGGSQSENWISGKKPNAAGTYFSLSEVRKMTRK